AQPARSPWGEGAALHTGEGTPTVEWCGLPMAAEPAKIDTPTAGDKIRYQIDRFLSWSPSARFIGLFGLSFLLISMNAVVVHFLMPVEGKKASVDAVQELIAAEGDSLEPELKEALQRAIEN